MHVLLKNGADIFIRAQSGKSVLEQTSVPEVHGTILSFRNITTKVPRGFPRVSLTQHTNDSSQPNNPIMGVSSVTTKMKLSPVSLSAPCQQPDASYPELVVPTPQSGAVPLEPLFDFPHMLTVSREIAQPESLLNRTPPSSTSSIHSGFQMPMSTSPPLPSPYEASKEAAHESSKEYHGISCLPSDQKSKIMYTSPFNSSPHSLPFSSAFQLPATNQQQSPTGTLISDAYPTLSLSSSMPSSTLGLLQHFSQTHSAGQFPSDISYSNHHPINPYYPQSEF